MAQPGLLRSLLHLSPDPIQVSSGPGDALMPAVSPDGARIFVIDRQLRGELVRHDGLAQVSIHARGEALLPVLVQLGFNLGRALLKLSFVGAREGFKTYKYRE